MNAKSLLLLVSSLTFCGCSTVQDDLKRNPEATIASCVKQVELSRPKFKADAMAYMGVSRERLADVLCDRLAEGVASGKINQRDLNGLIRTGQLTSKFAFLKG